MKTATIHINGIALALLCLIFSCDPPKPLGEPLPPDAPETQIAGAELTLLSKEPDIVTPTGIQIDEQNRMWVIENHTHVRQDDYLGPKVDKILVFENYLDHTGDKKITEFATDFIDGMSLAFTLDNKILVTTRASIIQFEDSDGDLVADKRDTLISLKTQQKFPHNGMSGLIVSPLGKLYFQCGENFGSYYEISGTDGRTLIGKEREGGSLYRCDPDGSNLERIGEAVWNCFAMTFDNFGNLFAVENDPDSRPPCRMLHIVKGGNYGFQFQHGRDGLSPLTSWFGQLPGTLPMVAGTGEAPSGILYYDQDRFGAETQGSMLVTAWGDNEIQQFPLQRKGSSFTAKPTSFIKGRRNFYPVGLALDDKGAVISTDWADVSYAVHGAGRIWRVSNPTKDKKNKAISQGASKAVLISTLNSKDQRIRTHAAGITMEKEAVEILRVFQENKLSSEGKMNLIWSAKLTKSEALPKLLELALDDPHELLRSAVVRMIVEDEIISNEQFYLGLIENDPSPHVKREAIYGLSSQNAFGTVLPYFEEGDAFIQTAILASFGKAKNVDFLLETAKSEEAHERLAALLCLRRSGEISARQVIPDFLNDPALPNRTTALKWVSEDNLKAYRSAVESSFSRAGNINGQLFDAYMVTFQYLDGTFNQRAHFMEGDDHVSRSFYKRQKFLLAAARNRKLSYEIRSRALSGINPKHESLSVKLLQMFLQEKDEVFQIEATRSLSQRTEDKNTTGLLISIARSKRYPENVRLEAIVGLLTRTSDEKVSKTLTSILKDTSESEAIRSEAAKSLGSFDNDEELSGFIQQWKPKLPNNEQAENPNFWKELSRQKGDPIAGARVFHNPRYQCGTCHRIDGRGGIFGPDLSQVGSNANVDRIVESILNPSDIVTPTYTGYSVTDKEGTVTVGRLDKDLDSKQHLQMILISNERARVAYDDITDQTMLEQSLMPANLHRMMTTEEFRDLVEYLAGQK